MHKTPVTSTYAPEDMSLRRHKKAQYNYGEYATSERGVKDLLFTQRRGIRILGSSAEMCGYRRRILAPLRSLHLLL
jgi:hypothetical protein